MPVPYGLGRKVRLENPPRSPFPKGERKDIRNGEGGTGIA